MLALDLHIDDLACQEWRATSDGWSCGTSWIRAFRHPALAVDGRRTGTGVALIVQERRFDRSTDIPDSDPGIEREFPLSDGILGELRRSSLDHCWVEVTGAPGQTPLVRLGAGEAGRAPLYVRATRSRIVANWSVGMVAGLAGVTLDLEMASHFIMGSQPYGRRTLFRGVSVITERSTAQWAGGEVDISYPSPAPSFTPRAVRGGADVVGAYRDTITALIRRQAGPGYCYYGLELSGGVDSAAAAICARDVTGPGLRSYGVIVPGERGVGQRGRRDDLAHRLGLVDAAVPGASHAPLSRFRAVPTAPWPVPAAEIYTEAFGALLGRAAGQGHRAMLTGTGGDELFMPHYDERGQEGVPMSAEILDTGRPAADYIPNGVRQTFAETLRGFDWAPRTVVPISALLAQASRAPLFLERGLWPLAPFCSREALALCRQLPLAWRREKLPHRRLLESIGCRGETVRPVLSESFTELFTDSVLRTARPLLTGLFRNPLIAELGLVRPAQLQAAYDHACRTGSMDAGDRFYEIAMLELAVRRLSGPAGGCGSHTGSGQGTPAAI